ncbi:hypothetical protein PEDI_02780 [Persicobacter diffluens]|uniref:Uncharacterized protein n=1 Tax=Persicobacter diffluens TaxID=981 RepID=A0AAN5AJR2_9BACT|nr:hypothetical protein PEDI_02780 [Persicobacter diffluens]
MEQVIYVLFFTSQFDYLKNGQKKSTILGWYLIFSKNY